MRARDLMTTNLVTIPPDAPLEALARVLSERGISGAPVVDADGALLGMVTESDLIRRLAAKEDAPKSWVLGLLASAAEQAARFARTHGHRARDVMTTDIASVTEDTSIEHVAHIIEEKKIRRVPVLRDGKLVGVVSRSDLIRALLAAPGSLAADAPDAPRPQPRHAERTLGGYLFHLSRCQERPGNLPRLLPVRRGEAGLARAGGKCAGGEGRCV